MAPRVLIEKRLSRFVRSENKNFELVLRNFYSSLGAGLGAGLNGGFGFGAGGGAGLGPLLPIHMIKF